MIERIRYHLQATVTRYGVCLLLLSPQARAAESFTIISDIDDTIRVTNVNDPLDRVFRFVFSNRSFSGMRELYQRWMKKGVAQEFIYLSAAPEVLRPRVQLFLDHQNFPVGNVLLRRSSDPSDRAQYKIARLEEILSRTSGRLMLIGDDTEADPEAYFEIYMRHPDRIGEIYIRRIRAVSYPPAIYPFLTSYDVARYEYGFDRFSYADAALVAERVVNDPNPKRVIPPFQTCPPAVHGKDLGEGISELDRKVQERVQQICESRI